MYKLIGADGKEYGPVTADQLRQWIAEGRANHETFILTENATEWRPLGAFGEFAGALAAGAPPPPGITGTLPSNAPMKSSGMAIAGFVLGLFSVCSCFCCCTGLPCSTMGLIFSSIALSQMKHNPLQGGRGLAIAGLVLSILGLILSLGLYVTGMMSDMASPNMMMNDGE